MRKDENPLRLPFQDRDQVDVSRPGEVCRRNETPPIVLDLDTEGLVTLEHVLGTDVLPVVLQSPLAALKADLVRCLGVRRAVDTAAS